MDFLSLWDSVGSEVLRISNTPEAKGVALAVVVAGVAGLVYMDWRASSYIRGKGNRAKKYDKAEPK